MTLELAKKKAIEITQETKVKAIIEPSDFLYLFADGAMKIGYFNTGRWIEFFPGGEK